MDVAEMIRKMLHPNITVSSLMMFARKLGKGSSETLIAFLEASCELDVFKTAAVAKQLLGESDSAARERVYQILAERCQDADRFTHLELLAIAVYNDRRLLQETSAFFTEELVAQAFALADVPIACWLLRMSLMYLPEAPCAMIRKSFCAFLLENSRSMDEELAGLVPVLPEYDAVDVLSALMELAGVKQVETLYGKPLFPEVDRMIRMGKDSVPFWEIFFDWFFASPHTPEELREDGLWHIQLYASEDIYSEVCAIFYLHVAIHYGVEHPVFAYIEGFEPPEAYGRRHSMRYRDIVDSLWDQPEELSRFLDKTALCNPFLAEKARSEGYNLLENAQDPVSYGKLSRLFAAKASPAVILNIFLSTVLRQKLPMEDVFYLAQRYEVLPDFLETVKDMPFFGFVTNQTERSLFLSPFSYCVTVVHVMNFAGQANKKTGKQKGKTIPYTIKDFRDGHIRIKRYEYAVAPVSEAEGMVSWSAAIEEFRDVLSLSQIPVLQLQELNLLQFKTASFTEGNDFNLFTRLILEYQDRLPVFLKVLELCLWNGNYRNKDWNIKKDIYDALHLYYEETCELFKTLFTFQHPAVVLKLYFSSIYKAILPLNEFLALADRESLLKALSAHPITCRLKSQETALCRPINVLCAPVCSVENMEGLEGLENFPATIADFTMGINGAAKIVLSPCAAAEVSIEERGSTFGYLSKNISISDRRAKVIAKFPSTDCCTYREIRFNMICVEDAILLRRADNGALMQLLQVLGKANPFAFQISNIADRIYLKQLRTGQEKEKAILSAATTMVLNAGDINCVGALYLHTNIKFYMRLPEFAQLVRKRRPDLAEQIPNLFDGTVFYAIADNEGTLWMPWVEQNTLRVAKEYAGQFLRCALRLGDDDTILVSVLDASQNDDDFFALLDICQLAGYQSVPYMEDLQNEFFRLHTQDEPEEKETAEKKNALDCKLSFAENLALLKERLRSSSFQIKQFAKDIGGLIRGYSRKVSDRDMESAITELTSEWIQRYPDTTKIRKYWYGIHLCFAENYHTFELGRMLVDQFYEYLYGVPAQLFEMKINESISKLTEKYESELPFDQALEQAKQMIQEEQLEDQALATHICGLIRTYRPAVSAERMEAEMAKLTEAWLQISSDGAQIRQPLFSIHQCFHNVYQSCSLGLLICQQFHQHLEGTAAHAFEKSIKKMLIRETNTSDAPKAEAQPDKHEQILSETSFEADLEQIRQMLFDVKFQSASFMRNITKLIRKYSPTVSAEDMQEAVAGLTTQWMQRYPYEAESKQFVVGVHTCFAYYYQSDALGLVLCEQARRYLEEKLAGKIVVLIKNTMRQSDSQLAGKRMFQNENPEDPAYNRAPFEVVRSRLEVLACDTAYPPNEFAKQVGKLIRKYSPTVSARDMETVVADLLAKWMPLHHNEPQMENFLIGLQNSFANRYQSVSLGIALCRQVRQCRGASSAQLFEKRLKETKEFRQYAGAATQIDSTDTERI